MKVLVCGGRDHNAVKVFDWLERNLYDEIGFALRLHSFTINEIIHGGARGADEGAGRWGKSKGIKVKVFHANWKKYGKLAGPYRNAQMAREGKPDIVIAFPGGQGTANMIMVAESLGIPVIKVEDTY